MAEEKLKPPKWLEEIQQKSWEPEILLSGIVLFGLLQLPDLIDQFVLFYKKEVSQRYTDIDNFASLMKLANFWLVSGLIIHLITRGIWIGLVGLSFVLPQGINHSRLNFHGKFETDTGRIPPINDLILKWERVCSSIFSITFLLFISIVGAYIYLLTLIILPYYIGQKWEWLEVNSLPFKIYGYAVLIIGLVTLFDYLTFGLLKRIKYLDRIYFPIARVVRIVTLSTLYRPVYYYLASNVNRWVFTSILLIFLYISYVIGDSFFDNNEGGSSSISMFYERVGTSVYSGNYEDRFEDRYSFRGQIPSEIIEGNTLRLFIPLHPDYDKTIKDECGEPGDIREDQYFLSCLQDAYIVFLNDSLTRPGLKFNFNQKTQQKGLLGWIDISTLPVGENIVEVQLALKEDTIHYSTIPFFKTLNHYEK